jgi:hypothetical protein
MHKNVKIILAALVTIVLAYASISFVSFLYEQGWSLLVVVLLGLGLLVVSLIPYCYISVKLEKKR